MLPEALSRESSHAVLGTVLAGLLLFFALEKALIWRHCHHSECEIHSASGPLVLFGDAFHNFVDGLMIATAFLASVPAGMSVTLAVVAHEIPQEIGDFGILLHAGYKLRRAFLLNALSSSTTIVGALLGYCALSTAASLVPYLLALGASSFLYIGTVDLLLGLQRETRPRAAAFQYASLVLGVALIAILRTT
jgi:zinc and cadmium transporter